ncbi:Exosome non-catalytic core component [Tilletia horrida]|uniref:Ribosomal RNA-processing protein 41 n=1 Tax=Tilletia horrida TaxID=155126 RepID=A0AAN6GR29_9BASI|nr:Exosome non-catalytic core component [Tilletia horrida]KAK0562375.1 Exosome non-catalytic core component [Tilletia horrida]
MSRVEHLNSGGFRSDGRRQYELRAVAFQLSPPTQALYATADGSASASHGLTDVLVSVHGPHEAKSRADSQHDRATVAVHVSYSPWSGMERKKRGRSDRRLTELASALEDTFQPVVQTHLYPRSQIDIYVQVLQQDGGVLAAAINASTLALLDAGIAMTDYVVAMSAGLHLSSTLLDLSSSEEMDLPNLTVAVLPRSKRVTLAQLETRLHADRFEEMFKLSIEACGVLHQEMNREMKRRTRSLADSMSGQAPARPIGGDDTSDTEDAAHVKMET